MKKLLFVGTLTIISTLLLPYISFASTTGHRQAACSYRNKTNPSKTFLGNATLSMELLGLVAQLFDECIGQMEW